MEFFARAAVRISVDELRQMLTFEQLPVYCSALETLLERGEDGARFYTLWGEFDVRRETIRDGVRFSLPHCPNALQWTLTAEGSGTQAGVVIHCTINRPEHDPDFVASLEAFVEAWREGLERHHGRRALGD